MMIHKEKTERELRDFGQVMTVACLVFSALGIWKRHTFTATVLVLLVIGAVFYAFAVFAPQRLRRAERYWMAFAEKIGTVVTFVVMLLTFYVIVTPIALLMRLLGKDPLERRIERERKSYWRPVEPGGPGTRPYLPY